MTKRAHPFGTPEGAGRAHPFALATDELADLAEGWLLETQSRDLSAQTLAARRAIVRKLTWFLAKGGHASCGVNELRAFLVHVQNGHGEPEGRWGRTSQGQDHRGVRPSTVFTYYRDVRALFNFLTAEGHIPESPVDKIRAPRNGADQIQPFTQEQVGALLQAARKSTHPKRDEAIIRFLFDTGARASELCGLRVRDVDLSQRQCRVLGKGDKQRTVPFGSNTSRALWRYLNERERAPEDPLFTGDRGTRRDRAEPLQRCGLLKLIHRLGSTAGIEAVRCSPHTFRHTFAVEFLRAGGNTFSLQQLLGHTSLAQTMKYVALAQADLAAQHRQFSPGDRLKTKNGDR